MWLKAKKSLCDIHLIFILELSDNARLFFPGYFFSCWVLIQLCGSKYNRETIHLFQRSSLDFDILLLNTLLLFKTMWTFLVENRIKITHIPPLPTTLHPHHPPTPITHTLNLAGPIYCCMGTVALKNLLLSKHVDMCVLLVRCKIKKELNLIIYYQLGWGVR